MGRERERGSEGEEGDGERGKWQGEERGKRNAEALLGIGTLMPHLRGVVRGRGGERRGVGHRLPKGLMPHVLTTCTSFLYVGQEWGAQIGLGEGT